MGFHYLGLDTEQAIERADSWHNAHKKLVWCTEWWGRVIGFCGPRIREEHSAARWLPALRRWRCASWRTSSRRRLETLPLLGCPVNRRLRSPSADRGSARPAEGTADKREE